VYRHDSPQHLEGPGKRQTQRSIAPPGNYRVAGIPNAGHVHFPDESVEEFAANFRTVLKFEYGRKTWLSIRIRFTTEIVAEQ